MTLNFREASEYAKRNPGSILTRDESGEFIVRNSDGSLVTEAIDASTAVETAQLVRSLEAEISQLRSKLESVEITAANQQQKYQEQKYRSCREREGLKKNIAKALSENATLTKKLAEANEKIDLLSQKLGKVSEEEWERINTCEENERKELADKRHKERHAVRCSCRGEVENCRFCYGRGTYETDGFGNKV